MAAGADPDRPWDFGRFIRTVTYFNEAPSPAKIVSSLVSEPLKALSALTGSSVEARCPVHSRSSGSLDAADLHRCPSDLGNDTYALRLTSSRLRVVRSPRVDGVPAQPRNQRRTPVRILHMTDMRWWQERKDVVMKMFEVPAASNGSSARDAGAGPRRPVVLVAGATGGVGKRVVRKRACPWTQALTIRRCNARACVRVVGERG